MHFIHSLTLESFIHCAIFLGHCATLEERELGFIFWFGLDIYLLGFFFQVDLQSLTLYLIIESIIKKFYQVFFPKGVSQDNDVVSFLCLVYLSVDLLNVICKRTLTCKNINTFKQTIMCMSHESGHMSVIFRANALFLLLFFNFWTLMLFYGSFLSHFISIFWTLMLFYGSLLFSFIIFLL